MIFEDDIKSCIKVLNDGGLILYPTDTVWGIGCDATNEKAVAKIYALKKRNEQKSMIVLLANEEDILKYTSQENLSIFDYIKGIQKPTTIIYDKGKNLAGNLIAADGSIGIRLVADRFCKTLIEAFGRPVVSTSSNISGFPPPGIFSDIDIIIKNGVDYIVRHRQEDINISLPSTIIRLDENGLVTILRP